MCVRVHACVRACACLSSGNCQPSSSDANLEILTKEKAVADVCKALQSYGGDSNLVDSACSALWSLSMNGEPGISHTCTMIPSVQYCMYGLEYMYSLECMYIL